MNRKEETMREEARKAIVEALENGYDGYYRDLCQEVFYTDCYISGAEQARKALEEFDVFKAIKKIQIYEQNNFGEISTDLGDPEEIINMLYYIIGEEVLLEMMDGVEVWEKHWDNRANEEINSKILQALKKKDIRKTIGKSR